MLNKAHKLFLGEGLDLIDNAIELFQDELIILQADRDKKDRDFDTVRYDNKSLDIQGVESLIADLEKIVNSYKKKEGIV